MEQTIHERLRILYKKECRSIKNLSEIIQVPEDTLKNVLSRGQKPNYDILLAVSRRFPQYSLRWLITGEGSMMVENEKLIVSSRREQGAIPFYSDLPISAGIKGLSQTQPQEEPSGYIKIPGISAKHLFPVIGYSMMPTIKPGDIIGVREVEKWSRLDPDRIYLIVTEDERMLKRLRIDNERDDILWCISTNYHEFKLEVCDIRKIYQVVFHGELM